jgi:uncharacterized coiled-coil DUF342 family protein
MALVKVSGTEYIRDTNSMALMNTDNTARNEYYAKVRMLKTHKDEINTVREEIAGIKEDMDEIKQLMLKLLEKGSNG